MSIFDEATLIGAFLVFCRVGACLGLAPGFSSPRIPMRIRLAIALAATIAIYPATARRLGAQIEHAQMDALAELMASELATGVILGLTARLLMASLETLASVASMASNLSSAIGPRPDEFESLPELANFVSFAAIVLLFVSDTHWAILRALSNSFDVLPPGSALEGGPALARVVDTLDYGFKLSFGIAAPFIVFGVTANLAFGAINRIAPQIAIYFVSVPFIVTGSLLLLTTSLGAFLGFFTSGFESWILRL